MIDLTAYDIKIESAFSLSWEKKTAYARPRNYDALSFRIKGNADYQHGKQKYHVNKNDILFIPAHYDYTLTANTKETVLVIHFFIENSEFDKLEIFSPSNPDVFERLFTELSTICTQKPIGYKARMLSLFYKIAEQIAIQDYNKRLLLAPPKLQSALAYFHENFTTPETNVESCAKHINTSTVYLRKIFNSNLNTSPLKYLNNLRMNYAIELLKTGYYSIEEIANLSGFYDPKYFSTLYKQKMGVLPSTKRKKAFSSAPRTLSN
jgi:AraC-like DNA-binding protein